MCIVCRAWQATQYPKRYTTPVPTSEVEGVLLLGYYLGAEEPRDAKGIPRPNLCPRHLQVLNSYYINPPTFPELPSAAEPKPAQPKPVPAAKPQPPQPSRPLPPSFGVSADALLSGQPAHQPVQSPKETITVSAGSGPTLQPLVGYIGGQSVPLIEKAVAADPQSAAGVNVPPAVQPSDPTEYPCPACGQPLKDGQVHACA